ncbi:MAG: MmcB family DNA repair protein [Sphingomonadales bacterium]|jgi:hypothetical protein
MTLEAIQNTTITAQDVARGVCRHFAACGFSPMCEVPFGNNRRVDVAGIDKSGRIIAVEIKVSVADFKSDMKWPNYLDYCDYFYFAVCPGFPTDIFDVPERCGLIIADRFQAHILKEAVEVPINAARRRAETLRFARRAARRLHGVEDPDFNQRSYL